MTLKKLEDKIETLETRLVELEGKQIYVLKLFFATIIPVIQAQMAFLWTRHLAEISEHPELKKELYKLLEDSAKSEYERMAKALDIKHNLWEKAKEGLINVWERAFDEAFEMYPELTGKEPHKA